VKAAIIAALVAVLGIVLVTYLWRGAVADLDELTQRNAVLKSDLVVLTEQVAVADRVATQHRVAENKLRSANMEQSRALHKAIEANQEWADTTVPADVQRALGL
jgi:hypothetical protein